MSSLLFSVITFEIYGPETIAKVTVDVYEPT